MLKKVSLGRARNVLFATLCGGLLVATAQTATAADDPIQGATMVEEPAEGSGAESDVGAQEVTYSPAGCSIKANNPHKSTSPPTRGMIKGYSLSQCTVSVDTLHVKSTVWRKAWWGGYQQKGAAGEGTVSNLRKVGRSGVWSGCEDNRWRTVGNGYSIEGGKKYSAEHIKYADVTNC
jgi:hypothetical protein